MRISLLQYLGLASLLFFAVLCGRVRAVEPTEADLYVAPDGDDAAVGTIDAPLRTLAGARDRIRTLRSDRPNREIVVLFRQGVYRFPQTVVFSVEDSAPLGGRVVYAAAPDEDVVFTAGVPIVGWRKLTEAETPAELPAAARGRIWTAELPDGLGRFNTLYEGNTRLLRARSKGTYPVRNYPRGTVGDRFTVQCEQGVIKPWANLPDMEMQVVPNWPWTINILPLVAIDPAKSTATTDVPATYYLGKPNFGHFPEGCLWFENTFAFLDEPGEWVLDTRARRIYLFPKGDCPSKEIVAPAVTELIRIEGRIDYDGPRDEPVRGICFRGITFTVGDRFDWEKEKSGWGLQHDWEMFDRPTSMLRLRGAEECVVEKCKFHNSGGTAVRLDLHCQTNQIRECEIEHVGGVGILLSGYGPGTKDVNRQNVVAQNHIHHVGELLWHSPAIFAWQSGENRIVNNLIHHTPYTAIVVSGRIIWARKNASECSRTIRWHEVDRVIDPANTRPDWKTRELFLHARKNIVMRNDIHHVMELLGDGNCIYISGCGCGNLVSQNYLHDVTSPRINANIRCDDDQHGTIITENVIYRCCGEGFIFKGNNTIVNNIVADLRAVSPDGTESLHRRGYIVIPSTRCDGSTVQRNIFYNLDAGQRILTENPRPPRGPTLLRNCVVARNNYFDPNDPAWGTSHLAAQRRHGIEAASISADPLFVDLKNENFQLKPNSPMLILGFRQIDIRRAGPDGELVDRSSGSAE